MDGGEARVSAPSPQGDETAPALLRNVSLSLFMCLGRAALKEEGASEIHLKGRWSTAPPPAGSPPLLSPRAAQSPLCAPAGERLHDKCLCVSLGPGGEGAGVSTNSQAFETLGPRSLACVHSF